MDSHRQGGTQVNYVFVDLEWEVAVLPYYVRTLVSGTRHSKYRIGSRDCARARPFGVECSSTRPVSANYNLGSSKRQTLRLFFRLPDKATAEQAVAQLMSKQTESEKAGNQHYIPMSCSRSSRVEVSRQMVPGGVDILPGTSDIGKESLCLLYSFPREYDQSAWKQLESVIAQERNRVKVLLGADFSSEPIAKVLRLDASVSPESTKACFTFSATANRAVER